MDTLLKRSSVNLNPDDCAEYKKARNKIFHMLKSAKREYYVSKLENSKNNAKEMCENNQINFWIEQTV